MHSDTLPSEGGIYTINADGSDRRKVTDAQDFGGEPAWSPDGAKLAFTRITRDPELWLDLDPDIYVMNADGSGVTRLTFDAQSRSPAWSPDGNRIAFTRGGVAVADEIYVMNADGSGVARLTSNPFNDNSPTWSPDGSKIAFASQRNGLDYQIYTMNADGTGVTRLTFGPGREVSPAWSPDGSKIAFSRLGGRLFVVNPDGSGLRQLADVEGVGFPVSWSPDGRMIAFAFDGQIHAVALRGVQLTRITSGGGTDGQPAWCCMRNP